MEMDLTLELFDLRRVSGFIDKDIVFHNTLTLANTSRTSTQNAISIVYEAKTYFSIYGLGVFVQYAEKTSNSSGGSIT